MRTSIVQCASRCRRVLNDISAQKCSALREAAPAFGGWGAATWVPRAMSTVATEGSPGASSQNPGEEAKAPGQRGWLLLLPAGFAAFLGVWQVGRRQWKQDLLHSRAAALQAAPVDLANAAHTPVEYTRVACRGRFLDDKSVFIGPRPRSAMGGARAGCALQYILITPLVEEPWGRTVLVNRGWVPAEWRDDPSFRARYRNDPSQVVRVEGIVRGSEPRGMFVPDNQPAIGQWFWVDVPALATFCGLPPEAPLIEVVAKEGDAAPHGTVPTSMDMLAFRTRPGGPQEGYPIPRAASDLLSFSVMPSDHRNYAATWFTLSAATAALALRALRR